MPVIHYTEIFFSFRLLVSSELYVCVWVIYVLYIRLHLCTCASSFIYLLLLLPYVRNDKALLNLFISAAATIHTGSNLHFKNLVSFYSCRKMNVNVTFESRTLDRYISPFLHVHHRTTYLTFLLSSGEVTQTKSLEA